MTKYQTCSSPLLIQNKTVFLLIIYIVSVLMSVGVEANSNFTQTFRHTSEQSNEYFTFGVLDFENAFRFGANLTISNPQYCEIQICVNYLLSSLNDTRYWPDNCDYYLSTSSNFTIAINTVLGLYQFNGFSNEAGCEYELSVEGEQCENGYFGSDCEEPVEIGMYDGLLVEEDGELTLFTTKISYSANKQLLIIDCLDQSNCDLTVYGRHANVPYINEGYFDFMNASVSVDGQLILNIPFPRFENLNYYFFTIVNNNAQNASMISVTTQSITCENFEVGENCAYITFMALPEIQLLIDYKYDFESSDWIYFFLVNYNENNVQNNYFNLGIQFEGDEQSLNSSVAIYTRLSNAPTIDYYDLKISNDGNNNEDELSNPFFYQSGDIGSYSYWYFGVYNPYRIPFRVWYNSFCPYNNCSSSTIEGTCNSSNHTCSCSDDSYRFDCEMDYNDNNDNNDNNNDNNNNDTHWSFYVILIESILVFVVLTLMIIGAVFLKYKLSSKNSTPYEEL